ncbi:hypothetical protein HDV00_000914 [Rhizophlyctis rosea]|nr:hypothetical protein HDV00_000914 [Rhizophlyctis rosea]
MCKLYNAADCYISPYTAEGFNLPVLEALACGIPVVVTKGGPTDDFTCPEVAKYVPAGIYSVKGTGQMLLKPDESALLECILSVVRNDEW